MIAINIGRIDVDGKYNDVLIRVRPEHDELEILLEGETIFTLAQCGGLKLGNQSSKVGTRAMDLRKQK